MSKKYESGIVDIVDAFTYSLLIVLLSLSFLGLCGCGKPPAKIEAGMSAAVAAVNGAAIAAGGFPLVAFNGTTVTGIGVGWRILYVVEDTDRERCGFHSKWTNVIGVRLDPECVGIDGEEITPILIHELGHAMGLQHVFERGKPSIMREAVWPGWTPQEAAESLIAELLAHDPGPYSPAVK